MNSCVTKHCRRPSALTYLGRDLCDKCWTRLAEADAEQELAILHEFGLTKVDGRVTQIDEGGQPEVIHSGGV